MFNRKKQPPIKSLMAQGCQIDGNFSFADGLRLDGSIHGNILGHADRPSILVISETAVVTGEIHADHIIINGTGATARYLPRHAGVAAQGAHHR